MKVFTLRQHDNPFGKKYRKEPGDVYEHPQPVADLKFGYVREASEQDEKPAKEVLPPLDPTDQKADAKK